ncbi:hypothetical protein CEXT_668001 [Caerostris extrusa]|uniref:Secreted protein n=1 Tax=Caerostris extrusa TaxID=172846 RepID=A0AAV4XAW7_CAEEX|nr:hypothetical protein CEXT_668001 [Caerostris extrusa]
MFHLILLTSTFTSNCSQADRKHRSQAYWNSLPNWGHIKDFRNRRHVYWFLGRGGKKKSNKYHSASSDFEQQLRKSFSVFESCWSCPVWVFT